MDNKDGAQSKSLGSWRNKVYDRIQLNSNEPGGDQGSSGESKSEQIGNSGEVDPREPSISSLQRTLIKFTGKILRGLLSKSQNDKRLWEDRLQEARACIIWYQNLLKKCEEEILLTDAQITEAESLLSQIENQE